MNQLLFSLHKLRKILPLLIGFFASLAQAQTFKMPCEVAGVMKVGSKSSTFRREAVEVEILTMGRNIYMKINGDSDYQMQASSLVTEEYTGQNLSTANQIGAKRIHRKTGSEYDIRVERESVRLHAKAEIFNADKKIYLDFEGPCSLPK